MTTTPECASTNDSLVDAASSLDALTETAVSFVSQLADKDRATMGTIKERLYVDVVAALKTGA